MTAPSKAKGIFKITIRALRQSRRKIRTISPVSSAPASPSVTRLRRELVT